MSLRSTVVALLISAVCGVSAAADGLITIPSPYTTTETLNRLAVLAQRERPAIPS